MTHGFFNLMGTVLKYLLAANILLVLLGLYQPWRVLWWMSMQNRIMVFKYYGVPAILIATILILI